MPKRVTELWNSELQSAIMKKTSRKQTPLRPQASQLSHKIALLSWQCGWDVFVNELLSNDLKPIYMQRYVPSPKAMTIEEHIAHAATNYDPQNVNSPSFNNFTDRNAFLHGITSHILHRNFINVHETRASVDLYTVIDLLFVNTRDKDVAADLCRLYKINPSNIVQITDVEQSPIYLVIRINEVVFSLFRAILFYKFGKAINRSDMNKFTLREHDYIAKQCENPTYTVEKITGDLLDLLVHKNTEVDLYHGFCIKTPYRQWDHDGENLKLNIDREEYNQYILQAVNEYLRDKSNVFLPFTEEFEHVAFRFATRCGDNDAFKPTAKMPNVVESEMLDTRWIVIRLPAGVPCDMMEVDKLLGTRNIWREMETTFYKMRFEVDSILNIYNTYGGGYQIRIQ